MNNPKIYGIINLKRLKGWIGYESTFRLCKYHDGYPVTDKGSVQGEGHYPTCLFYNPGKCG